MSLVVWMETQRVLLAYRALRRLAERHRALGHDVEFEATGAAHICLTCLTCQRGN